MANCNPCDSCWNYESYLDEMTNILSGKGILSAQYIVQLKHLYRSFICKYPIGSLISDGSINARVDQYRLVRDTGHIKVYLLDSDDNLIDYLIEDLAKLITPEGDDARLFLAYNSYISDYYKMMEFMNKIHDEEVAFNAQLMVMYPVNTEVGVYLDKVIIKNYTGNNHGIVEVLVDCKLVRMTTSDFYQGIIEYKNNFKKNLVGGNY